MQLIVARSLVAGRTNQEIVDYLASEHRHHIQIKTVKWHITEIYKKVGVKNRSAFIAIYAPPASSKLEGEILKLRQQLDQLEALAKCTLPKGHA